MRKLAVFLLVVVLLTSFANTVLAAARVFVNAPGEYASAIAGGLLGRGAQVVNNSGEADVTVKVDVINVENRIRFNWWVLLLPFWPFVPWTRTVADASVNVSVMQGSRTVFNMQASESVKSSFFLGDLYLIDDDKVEELEAEAVKEAVMKALRNYSF